MPSRKFTDVSEELIPLIILRLLLALLILRHGGDTFFQNIGERLPD
jgi:hypothetical protein